MKKEVTKRITLPAEWEEQEFVQLTWPHEETDWAPMLDEITATYIEMAQAISERERLLIVAPDVEKVKSILFPHLTAGQRSNVVFHECPTNDTWARDHAFLTLSDGTLLDFCFNGWGEKFEASLDNAINRSLYSSLFTLNSSLYESHLDFVLEGGSIESDGKGTIYTTRCCLLAPHRNQPLTEQQIEQELKRRLRADRIVWLDDEPLPGDDTDGHIDTLARILPDGTLLRMPLPDPIYDEDGTQLPATYANYLIINGAVLVPTYGQPANDERAIQRIQEAFPDREMIPIDSRSIIRQHGSIHCCTMQYPKIIDN
jgi:agmatine/peptidylarginine deiminase